MKKHNWICKKLQHSEYKYTDLIRQNYFDHNNYIRNKNYLPLSDSNFNVWPSLVGNSAFYKSTKQRIKRQSNYKNWLIIVFTNLDYLEVAKIWYDQLTSLGYKSHTIVALNEETFEALEGSEYRSIRAFSELTFVAGFSLHDLWLLRWKTVLGLINQGHNVFLNDADSIWKKNIDLNTVFSQNYDILHVYDRKYPRKVYDAQKFVVNGGVIAYRATDLTKKLLKIWIDECESKGCDDQDTMNRYYLEEGVVWNPHSEMLEIEQSFNRTGVIRGDSEMAGLKISVVYDGLVFRGNQPKFCDEGNFEMPNLWIYLPQADKTGESKMQMLVKYKKCFTEAIRNRYFS